jgi:hypothetical protein
MVDSSLTEDFRANSTPRNPFVFVEYEDDDDDADCDDFDDEESPLDPSREHCLSRPDFGSPEWWSRT